MGFMTYARKARNDSLHPGLRLNALCHCVEHFAPLGFQATVAFLGRSVGVSGRRWTSAQLDGALDLLIAERQRFLDFDAEWTARRVERKDSGHRRVGADELAELRSMPWMTWPLSEIRNRRTVFESAPPDDAIPFRPAQRADYEVVNASMPRATIEPHGAFTVCVYDEWLRIPYRIYNPVPSAVDISRLSASQALMLSCLYTRHCDGHVRQRHLQRVLSADEQWAVPYVVALIGDYVVEILNDIERNLSELDVQGSRQRRRFGRFAEENRSFVALTRQRVESYWREYYTHDFCRPNTSGPDPANRPPYPGFVLIQAIEESGSSLWRDA
jgi:hypothetical protein